MIDQEPAFPVNFANDTEWDMEDPFGRSIPEHSNSQYTGITKRDYFASAALQGMLASGNLAKSVPDSYLAAAAYNLADAMIVESSDD